MLYYIIPEYKDGLGSCCRVGDHNGEELQSHTLQAMLKTILSERGMDLKALRRQCSKEMLQRNLLPLYLGSQEVLMPLKVRNPRVKRDGGYGYINAMAIKKIECSRVIMENGTSIAFLESRRAVTRRLRVSQRLQQHMGRRPMGTGNVDMPSPSQTAATKEDVAVVVLEVTRLRQEIIELMKGKE